MNETEQIIDGLDEVEIANTSIDEIDSENINFNFCRNRQVWFYGNV